MDYEIDINGEKFIPGGDINAHKNRLNGKHGTKDWIWRWSESAIEWGKKEKAFVIKNGRIYTKSYLKVRKRSGKNEWEPIDPTKAYTTLSFIDNRFSNDNAKKELDTVFVNGSTLFRNPKPSSLIKELIKMVCDDKHATILDFFAGSGTTGQAVLELNETDKGHRQFILATSNETTPTTPNGVVRDVTSKRLKRIMTGSCYDGTTDFEWIKKNKPLGGNLLVLDMQEVSNFETVPGATPFDVIDETLYGNEKFETVREKIEWVCDNFEITQKRVEEE